MGSCSKEHEPAAPVLEWTTDIATEAPLFVVPETTVTIGYAAQHVQAVTTDALPDGWNVQVDEEAQAIVISATADAETSIFRLSACRIALTSLVVSVMRLL